ncbi:MAG TPA: polysaccharide pyruvyl transferase family protein [Clostridia bacterium]|nr:polysaccharide pyruvyl transferase family protein [Clostridia bacterium]
MRKILVMIPAGEMYDHDCVRWYKADDVQRSIDSYHNIGDAFVHDSSLKILDYDAIDVMEITSVDQNAIDRYNAEYAYCFLRGSNYINSSMRWQQTGSIIEKLKIPVIAFGVGAQAPAHGPLELSAETRRILHAIADRCETLGVRGAYTADVLWGIGVRNVRVIGCPTLFRRRDPDLRIELPPLETVRRVAFTLRREVSATYARDIQRYLAVQRETALGLDRRFELSISAQGEVEEKKVVLGTAEQREAAIAALAQAGWLGGEDDPLTRLYRTRLFYSDVVADYDAYVRRHDLVLGYRLHGNLIALANGVPSIYFTYDSRTAEFAETFRIPAFDVFGGGPFELEALWDRALFERFNQAYCRGYREMRTFLDENRVAHRLLPAQAATAACHAA